MLKIEICFSYNDEENNIKIREYSLIGTYFLRQDNFVTIAQGVITKVCTLQLRLTKPQMSGLQRAVTI